MKVKEWCIALDNVSPYIDPVLGLRYKFLKGERATKEKVFNMIPDMTEEEYARCFRPATEEEINGEFEWDGEQYVLVKEKDTSGLTELEKAISKAIIGYMFLPKDLDHCVNKHIANNYYRKCAQEILSIARKQIAEEIDVNNIKGLDFDAVIRAHIIGRYFEARPFALECYHKGIEDVLEQVKKGKRRMKSIKEKAAHYDAALEYAHCLIEQCKEGTCGSFHRADLDKMFPELAESEDERIRTRLIDYFSGFYDRFATDRNHTNVRWEGLEVKKVLAWLEAQGEQKPAEWSKEDDSHIYSITEKLKGKFEKSIVITKFTLEEDLSWLKSLKERVGCEADCTITKEWSEDDEERFESCIKVLQTSDGYDTLNAKWFKSLKDRVQQPKQEWGEEDDDDAWLNDIISKAECNLQLNKDEIDWLKSLKERVWPKQEWKPSKEQMEVIEAVINNRSFQRRHLDSLYNDLKKLKGE